MHLKSTSKTPARLTFLTAVLITVSTAFSFAQSAAFWQDLNPQIVQSFGTRYSTPEKFRALQLNTDGLRETLKQAPKEFSDTRSNVIISIPIPDGSFADFEIFESPVMAQGLAAHYPNIKTYVGIGTKDQRARVRLDMTNFGFHAMILSPRGDVFIDPISNDATDSYICYNKRDLHREYLFDCGVKESDEIIPDERDAHESGIEYRSSGTELRKYRLALACTGEYAATKGGTVSGALSGMVTSINRITGIYESELAIRLELIDNDTALIYLNSATDPYTNNDGYNMLDQNQSTIDGIIGSSNYDIGHVFSTGGGGIAGLGVVCVQSQKSNGVTGLPNPVGDAFDVDYVAHEMGHQFGATHTFNSTTGSCGGGNRWASTAFEPGSASTIMGYAGICSPNDLQSHSDPFFHTVSYDQILDFVEGDAGATCPVIETTANTPPSVDAHADYTIPFQTPFKLTGSASDADGDSLSYLWDEIDKGPSCGMNAPTGNSPSFRSFKADSVPYRYFPKLSTIITGTISNGEKLPTYARTLNFRLTVRDNKLSGGGLSYDDDPTTITVINTGTPFKVTYPTTAENWAIGTTYQITWDISSTNVSPINCQNVNILLSTDGGYTYPVALASNTVNDGTEAVTVPVDVSLVTNSARIMLQAADNIFFDISDVNFSIGTSTGITSTVNASTQIDVFPNPTTGLVNISFEGISGEATMVISDAIGNVINRQIVSGENGHQVFNADLSAVSQGIYLVELITDKGNTVKKIIKQ